MCFCNYCLPYEQCHSPPLPTNFYPGFTATLAEDDQNEVPSFLSNEIESWFSGSRNHDTCDDPSSFFITNGPVVGLNNSPGNDVSRFSSSVPLCSDPTPIYPSSEDGYRSHLPSRRL